MSNLNTINEFDNAIRVYSCRQGRHRFPDHQLLPCTLGPPHPEQIRLFPSFNSSLTLYQTPIPTHPDNLSSAALALSGYDIGPNNALNFRTELSINTNANNFQILLTTLNSTRLYSMNFFMVAINKEASSWLHIQSNCKLLFTDRF